MHSMVRVDLQRRIAFCAFMAESSLGMADILSLAPALYARYAQRVEWYRRRARRYSRLAFAIARKWKS